MLKDKPRLKEASWILEEVVYISIDHIFPLLTLFVYLGLLLVKHSGTTYGIRKHIKKKICLYGFVAETS